jgi:uncharacterized protein (TIGR04255 family)
MQIPVKITPDRIRDSIVQVFFKSDIPFEPLIGFCYAALEKSGWKYTNRQPVFEPQKGIVIELVPAPQHFFVKDNVRLQLFPNQSFAFNCINKYIGWKEYGGHIRSVIDGFFATGHFTQFNRIGIRYISEFANIDVLQKIMFNATVPAVSGQVVSSTYRFVIEENEVTKNIQIGNKLPVNAVLQPGSEPVNFVSLLDVDIVSKGLAIKDIETLWQEIDNLHTTEKITFFGLLTDEFLQSLNPEYS